MLGDKIKQIRKDKNISQKKFAEILEIPVSTLANYENNHRQPNIETLYKISSALNISPVDLFPRVSDNDTNIENDDSYLFCKEFETLAGTYIFEKALDEKNDIIIPFIKYINETYLKSKYDIDKILHTSTEDLMNNSGNYSDLKFLLVDIIDIRLNRYNQSKK
ncbi:helix-turn-helix transcriptional regulator [Clostridioides difficile]